MSVVERLKTYDKYSRCWRTRKQSSSRWKRQTADGRREKWLENHDHVVIFAVYDVLIRSCLWMRCLSITGCPAWSDQEHHYSPLNGMLSITGCPAWSDQEPLWMGCLSITGFPAWSDQEHYYSPLNGMLVHHRVSSMKWPGASLFPSGWDACPSQGTQHEATRSITVPPSCIFITGSPAWSD